MARLFCFRAVANAGPAIFEVQHNPLLPAAGQPVLVTAQLHDPDGLQAFVHYRIDPDANFTTVAMTTSVSDPADTSNAPRATGSNPVQRAGTKKLDALGWSSSNRAAAEALAPLLVLSSIRSRALPARIVCRLHV